MREVKEVTKKQRKNRNKEEVRKRKEETKREITKQRM